MAVVLRRSDMLPDTGTYTNWLAVTGTEIGLPSATRLPDLPRRLQQSFDRIRDAWLVLGKQLSGHGTGIHAHAATGAAYVNDLGLMLAWVDLIETLTVSPQTTLVVCDDPWLFRRLGSVAGVTAGDAPAIWRHTVRLASRGVAARLAAMVRTFHAAIALRPGRRKAVPSAPAIVVYGHPQSTPKGGDAYFGSLLADMPELCRALHTDCMVPRARDLCGHARTFSLHGWGHPLFSLRLLFIWWRLPRMLKAHPDHWLLRRAIALENGGGSLAMTGWQAHCQNRWLKSARPVSVAWPWENHPWERSLCRSLRRFSGRSVGYQHAVVGRHQFNFSPASNPETGDTLPDVIMCNGPAYRDQLERLGHDPAGLRIGGAFRIRADNDAFHDPSGPVYIALSSVKPVSRQMLQAVSGASFANTRFVAKDHPLYPMDIRETGNLKRTEKTIPESSGLRAVVYSTGTTGLEGLLAGIPTYRFLPDDRIAPDILPDGVSVPECTADELAAALAAPEVPPSLEWSAIMAPVDIAAWRSVLAPGC